MIRIRKFLRPAAAVALASLLGVGFQTSARDFNQDVLPLIETYCYDCHGCGSSKGGVVFDEFVSTVDRLSHVHLWQNALKNLCAGLIPPAKRPADGGGTGTHRTMDQGGRVQD